MTQKTKEAARDEQTGGLASGLMVSIIEKAPVNIICANLDLEITYVNPKPLETLAELQHLLPVAVSDLLGTNIDVFHENPSYQRKLLGDPRNLPHTSTISLGEEKLELLVTAMRSESGEYLGPMVTWSVITEKLALLGLRLPAA